MPADYAGPGGSLSDDLQFVRWDIIETPNPEAWAENELFQEAYGLRPSGPNDRDILRHGIYAKDLSGSHLDRLTPELPEELGIVLEIT